MSDQMRQPTEAEMQAAYEEQLKQIQVEEVVAQSVVSFVNLGARKAGLAGGSPEEVDPEQVRLAIDAARALLPLIESQLGPDAATLRDALSQLQLAYVRLGGTDPGASGDEGGGGPGGEGGPGGSGAPGAGGTGSAQRSGRLWVPGQ